jgi:hypothetical protein
MVETAKRDSLSLAGKCLDTIGIQCGGEGRGEGAAKGMAPLIRPSGTFSPTVEFFLVFSHRLWWRRVAIPGELDAVHVAVKTTFRS